MGSPPVGCCAPRKGLSATWTSLGDLQNTIFVDPASLGMLQNTIFVGPVAPGMLQTTIFVDPAAPGMLQNTIFVNPLARGMLQNIIFVDPAAPGMLPTLWEALASALDETNSPGRLRDSLLDVPRKPENLF